MSYYPEPGIHNRNKIKDELDLSNYATKSYVKNATRIDTSKFVKNVELGILKYEVDKLDVDKLKTAPIDVTKLSEVLEKDVFQKTVYD